MVIKVGIVGGTGYTGVELLRLLAQHPEVELKAVTSRTEAGMPVSQMYPNLRGRVDLPFSEPSLENLGSCDVVFFATPNGVAMKQVPELLAQGVKIIDLAADFRLKDPAQWQQWYGMPHTSEDLLAEAVYGLPEVNREAIKTARLVANPGCYTTSAELPLIPLLRAGVINPDEIIIDAKSGTSGAGRSVKEESLFCEVSEGIHAYGLAGHRHAAEIEQELALAAGRSLTVTFIPHLMPMNRGILSTIYVRLSKGHSVEAAHGILTKAYAEEPFVRVLSQGSSPATRHVRGSNMTLISITADRRPGCAIITCALDNLVKGASGQAIQNMNLVMGFAETTGLEQLPMFP